MKYYIVVQLLMSAPGNLLTFFFVNITNIPNLLAQIQAF